MKSKLITILFVVLTINTFNLDAITSRRTQYLRKERQLKKEVREGTENFSSVQQMMGGTYNNPEISNYVKEILAKLVPHCNNQGMPFEVEVVASSVPNALTLPGGKIVISRGLLLLLDNEAQVAAILGHEIHHAVAHHSAKQQQRDAGVMILHTGLSFLDFGLISGTVGRLFTSGILASACRGEEIQCDLAGVSYMQRAGYDPQEMVVVQKKLMALEGTHKKSFFKNLYATHPPSKERIKRIQNKIRYISREHYVGKEKFDAVMQPLLSKKEAYDLYEQGKASFARRRWDDAIEKGQKALAIEPNESLFHLLIGKAQYLSGNTEAALIAFNRAIELNPSYYDTFACRASCFEKLGDKTRAKEDRDHVREILKR
jgi:predicted Zn-dependent protease